MPDVWHRLADGNPHGPTSICRSEADHQTGCAAFEVATQQIRPAAENGQPIGDLLYDLARGLDLDEVGAASAFAARHAGRHPLRVRRSSARWRAPGPRRDPWS
jgi:hypothetical protein